MRVDTECWQKLTYSLMYFSQTTPTFYLTNSWFLSIFQKQIGIFPLEISKCPYIGEFFLLTRASLVSLRLINNHSVYIIYFWSPCIRLGRVCLHLKPVPCRVEDRHNWLLKTVYHTQYCWCYSRKWTIKWIQDHRKQRVMVKLTKKFSRNWETL